MKSSLICPIALVAAMGLGAAVSAYASSYQDDFSDGMDELYWLQESNQPLYSMDDTQGDIRFSKPVGGDYSLQYVSLRFRGTVQGDFDVSVVFRDAYIDQVDGLPGNQVQLNTLFGGQLFCIVRSDEPLNGGHNHHVWIDPPGIWVGAAPDESTTGSMRIRRIGDQVEGYIHGNLIYSDNFNYDDVTSLIFVLQNNCTVDSTAVTFDDFELLADAVTAVGPPLSQDLVSFAPPWPNPSVGEAWLGFGLAKPMPVVLTVFDLQGRRVCALFRESRSEGYRAVHWNGFDDQGREVPTGIYILRLEAGNFVKTRSLTFLR